MKTRNGTFEGQTDWGFSGEHLYHNSGDGDSVVFHANEKGCVLVSVEWLDTTLGELGYSRV